MNRPRLCLIDGSLGGARGNTSAVVEHLLVLLRERADVEEVHLADDPRSFEELESVLLESQGFVFASGTYWDSWGSPLQTFLERVTPFEGGPMWLGKPAAVVVTMHSVGGKEVLSRLQGVLSTLGLLIPPMTGIAYSLAAHLAAEHVPSSDEERAGFLADFWSLDDLPIVAHNLLEAVRGGRSWRSWRVDERDPARSWMRR